MKKVFSILLAITVGILVGWNMIYAKPDPFTLVSGMVVWIFVCLVWIIILFSGYFQTATIYITIIIIFGSAGSAVYEVLSVSTPLATVEIDNSTELYPMPEDPNPAQQETMEWIEGKWVIKPGEGAQKVGLAGIGAGFVSFLLMVLSGWILGLSFMPEKIKGSVIPIQLILTVIFCIISVVLIASPINTQDMDLATTEAVSIQWWGGFLRNSWWPWLLSGVSTIVTWIRKGAIKTGLPIVMTIISALFFFVMPVATTVFNPAVISWTACTQQVSSTALTMSLCQEAYASGSLAMTVASMAWGFIVATITAWLGFDDEDDE